MSFVLQIPGSASFLHIPESVVLTVVSGTVLVDRKRLADLMQTLGLEGPLGCLVLTAHLYWHVMKTDRDHAHGTCLCFKQRAMIELTITTLDKGLVKDDSRSGWMKRR